MNKPDYSLRRRRVNQKLLDNAKVVIPDWLDGEIKGEEYVAINPLRRDDKIGSFSVNLTKGVWKDFAVDNFAGPDLVSLYMALKSLEESTALDELESLLSEPGLTGQPPHARQSNTPAKPDVQSAPAPTDCHLPPDTHPDLGVPSMTWEYRSAEGLIAFYVYRFETDKGKETRPVSYNPEKQDWQWRLPSPPLPIYHLDQITDDGDTGVVIVEGEKAADAATEQFPDYISTTSSSGSSNALKSDWSPLYGRSVTLIPDADEPGTKYAMTVAADLLVNGADVFIVDTLALGWTDGDDVADYPDLTQDWLTEHRLPIKDWADFRGMDEPIIEAAARMSPLDYDRRKDALVDLLGGVGKRTLDEQVKRAKQAYAKAEAEADESDASGLFAGEEPWPEVVDGKALVEEIQSVIRSHVILSHHDALAVALWIVLSYVFRAFRVCPRLLVSSPEKRCGKTTLLETIQAMCFRGLAAANISAASLFRGLEAWSPTLLIDEADTFLHGNDELRGILNSGHTRSTAFVIRTVGDEHEPRLFPTFAPIAIGMIKRPPDTLLDRSVVIRLQRKLGTDPVTPLPLEAENAYRPIRQKCLRWAQDNVEELRGDRELTPAEIGNDRARDNWIPLTAIAQQCGLLEAAHDACRQLTLKEDDSLTVELLADIQQIFQESNKERLPSQTLVKKLVAMEERPWAEFSHGKPLNPNLLARMLKDFDVHTRQAKAGSKNLKHYFLEDLAPLFERYLNKESGSPLPKTTATPLPTGGSPDDTKAAAVADSVAEADLPPDAGAESLLPEASSSDPDPVVAKGKTLPLPTTSAPAQSGRGLEPGSGVADKNRGKPFTFSHASSKEDRDHDAV